MSIRLLDHTREILNLLRENPSKQIRFNDICELLAQTLHSTVLVISRRGKVLGIATWKQSEAEKLLWVQVGERIEEQLNERLLHVSCTKENVDPAFFGLKYRGRQKQRGIITPIIVAGERLGTTVLFRSKKEYRIEDIILSEYATTVVGLEMLRSLSEEYQEECHKEQVVQSVLKSLTQTEMLAVTYIFEELEGNEGILVGSKLADRVGITRSVIVNAIRKLESAGIIESRSSGMKGTWIRIINEKIFSAFQSAEDTIKK